jgi:hypothetical protein
MRPIAIVNRFDLLPADYGYCGEYRIIFSATGDDQSKLHVALEGVVPNPEPAGTKQGCTSVAKFWRRVAETESAGQRRHLLEDFFFRGAAPLRRVLEQSSSAQRAEVRTSRIGHAGPVFAQYVIRRKGLERVALHNTPDGSLFDASIPSPFGMEFRRQFIRQIRTLAIDDVNRYSMKLDSGFSVKTTDGLEPSFNYTLPFRRSQRTVAGQTFRNEIAAELRKIDSPLSPEDIISRAETRNCVGCHQKSGPVGGNVIFPKAFDSGEHLADDTVSKPAAASPALNDVFMPHREKFLEQFLMNNATGGDR